MKTLLILLLLPLTLTAQHSVDYFSVLDNKEYHPRKKQMGTIALNQIYYTYTTDSINIGLSYTYNYGSELFDVRPKPILYYKSKYFIFGVFPRHLMPSQPLALVSDSILFTDNSIDGILFNFKNTSIIGDWVSQQNEFRREKFKISLINDYNIKHFTVKSYSYLFHNGGRTIQPTRDYVEDNAGNLITFGLEYYHFYLDIGLLSSMYRLRDIGHGIEINSSIYMNANIDFNTFGFDFTYKYGDKHHFLLGDNFYNTSTEYYRTDLYIYFIKKHNLNMKLILTMHCSDGDFDSQQCLSLNYSL